MPNNLIQVVSSNIDAVGFDEATNTLTVRFHTGKVYEYSGVAREYFEQMLNSESVGQYFHRRIRSNFECRRKE